MVDEQAVGTDADLSEVNTLKMLDVTEDVLGDVPVKLLENPCADMVLKLI
ncbi:hypothetical protein HYS50_00510 [Candidatus Woesearchaeota archaeon]|nr:hypothetical protein [Candidatus Woesearchaeota archaeon]